MGRAQTNIFIYWGCRTHNNGVVRLAEHIWKDRQYRVIAPYAKIKKDIK